MAVLEIRELTVRFGGRVALDGVTMSAERGRITGLIGPNGAGKTTLFNAVTGMLRPDDGTVELNGNDLARCPSYRRARAGIARTFQRLELFGSLTVRENLRLAAGVHRRHAHDPEPAVGVADRIIEQLQLTSVAEIRADTLPTGQGRLVELGRALASKPSVLLLDEPASGQDERETSNLAVVLRELADDGLAVLLVEHDMSLVMRVCDDLWVLDFGQLIASGTPSEIRTNQRVLAGYLGQTNQQPNASPSTRSSKESS